MELNKHFCINEKTCYRLCSDSFVRRYGVLGYINNQLTNMDRVYDENGAVFLSMIDRSPSTVSDTIVRLLQIYPAADPNEIQYDFAEFLQSLEEDLFIITGKDSTDLDKKEPRFCYETNPYGFKSRTKSYWDPAKIRGIFDSQSTLEEYCKSNPTLIDLQFELTSRCNERCRHCYLPVARLAKTLESDLVLDILDQMREMGTLSVSFSGGEPMLHPDLPLFLRRARENDFSIAVLSNGTALTDNLANELAEARLAYIQFSVYSTIPEEHDYITRIPGSHTLTMQAIEKLMARQVPVQISCPTMKSNYKNFKKVLQWGLGLGLKTYTDYIMMARADCTDDNLAERLEKAEIEKLLKDIIEHDESYRDALDERIDLINLQLPSLQQSGRSVCGVGRSTLCLGSNGYYFPCAGWQGMQLGNAYQQTLKDVWFESPKLTMLRKVTWDSFPECMVCNYSDYCAMCMVRNFNEGNGDLFKISQHFCNVAAINKKIGDEYVQKRKLERQSIPKN